MEHSHLIHDLLIVSPLLLLLVIILKKQLVNFSKFQMLCLIILGLFVVVHENPGKLIFASHHQSEESHQQKHTCCMPLVSEFGPYSEIVDATFFAQYIIIPTNLYNLPLLNSSIKNKSPPIS